MPSEPHDEEDISGEVLEKIRVRKDDVVWRLLPPDGFPLHSSSLTTLLRPGNQRINLSGRSGTQTWENIFKAFASANALKNIKLLK